jgi:glycosyltransferase involved in cell wall biosynthesis
MTLGATAAGSAIVSRGTRVLDIVCLATRAIDNPMPTNVQHLMRRLAARHRVLYVEPAVDLVHVARRGRRPATPPVTADRDGGRAGLEVLRPLVLPWGRRSAAIARWNRRLVHRAIATRMRQRRFDRAVLWLFSPREAWLAGGLGEAALCYHVTDDYAAMPGAAGDRSLATADEALLGRADCVFVTSAAHAAARGLDGPRVHVVPNVADVAHFRTALDPATVVPSDIASVRHPIAGFVGAVDAYKVDLALLRACAVAAPEISWVLIGPVAWSDATTRLDGLDLPNVHVLGARGFATLPAYVKAFDVALIPYRQTAYTRATSPLKLWEYLAAGRPVVATDLPGVADAGGLVTIARDPAAFVAAVRRHVGEGGAHATVRADAALAHAWPRRVAEIEAVVLAAVEMRR